MSTALEFKGATALVTGARRGIGRAIALSLARGGATVGILDIDDDIESAAAEISADDGVVTAGGRALGYLGDVTCAQAIATVVSELNRTAGTIGILVNNAGTLGHRSLLWESDPEAWRRTIEVNLIGMYVVTRAVVPQMVTAGAGRVVNISSISGKQGSVANSAYSASKHGVLGLTRSLAGEFGMNPATRSLTVNAVCPGVVDTAMGDEVIDQLGRLIGTSRQEILDQYVLPNSLQKRLLDIDEIADMAVYLVSEKARGITGQAINVCGGSVFY